MANISTELVKELRERTQAGVLDCRKALQEANGDMEAAIKYLREKGLAAAAKKAGRVAGEGTIDSYIHMGGRIGVLIEVNCETDFVAKTDQFKELVRDLAMQVAAARPVYVSRDDVSATDLERERSVYEAAARNEGKPEKIIPKIVEGRVDKFYKESCLLEQVFIKDDSKTVQQVISEKIATLGENITVSRFARFEKGERVSKNE